MIKSQGHKVKVNATIQIPYDNSIVESRWFVPI